MDDFAFARQIIQSKATSLSQVAATFTKTEFAPGSLNLDYGGGRYDKATELLAARGARNAVYDPFNRDEEHNLRARLLVAREGGASTVTVNNVLNVVAEPEAMLEIAQQAANGLRPDGEARFLIHEGDRTGVGRSTSKGWQRNQKASDYVAVVETFFDNVARKGNMIAARGPRPGGPSLFDAKTLQAEILARAKALGAPMPSARHGAGKLIGGCLYLHRSCWDALPQGELAAARARLPNSFSADVAKWEPKTGCFSFIICPGFDVEEEPAIGDAYKVFPDGAVSRTPAKKDPQIYHHKWNFVRPSYSGFDYCASVARTIGWAGVDCDRSRIGTRSFWEAEVVWPHLGGRGALGPRAKGSSARDPTTAPRARTPKA